MTEQPRLLIYSHDAYGLGHLTRCFRIAHAFHNLYPSLSTLIVTGSAITGQFEKPSGVQLLEIPPLTWGNGEKISRDPRYSLEEATQRRRELLLGAVRDF